MICCACSVPPVIDEISMVRADLLDAVDDVLRRYRDDSRAFGGAQLLMIGDLHQLPPVIKPEDWELLRSNILQGPWQALIPDLVPEGRVQRGEAVVFPNLSPYDEHSAVAVMCREHFISPSGFTPGILSDAFRACIDYFDHFAHFPGTDFPLVCWNYMPAAGSSQVHPHLQVYATDVPGNSWGLNWPQATGTLKPKDGRTGRTS